MVTGTTGANRAANREASAPVPIIAILISVTLGGQYHQPVTINQ
jgi:hypothetical protein